MIEKFLKNKNPIKFEKNDTRFLDALDHVLSLIINQAKDDKKNDIPFDKGPIFARKRFNKMSLGNTWYSDEI